MRPTPITPIGINQQLPKTAILNFHGIHTTSKGVYTGLLSAYRQGINNVYVDGDTSVTKTYPVAFTKFQLPMCVNHTGNYSGWAYCTNNGDLTSVNIYATHEWMNLAVVAIGV